MAAGLCAFAANLSALAARTSGKGNSGLEHAAPSLLSAADGESSWPAYAMRPPAVVARMTARKAHDQTASCFCLWCGFKDVDWDRIGQRCVRGAFWVGGKAFARVRACVRACNHRTA